jgi:hypothetical protein
VKKAIQQNVLGFEPHNERKCKLRIKGKYRNVSLICVHVPAEDSDDTVKGQVFEALQKYKIASQNMML